VNLSVVDASNPPASPNVVTTSDEDEDDDEDLRSLRCLCCSDVVLLVAIKRDLIGMTLEYTTKDLFNDSTLDDRIEDTRLESILSLLFRDVLFCLSSSTKSFLHSSLVIYYACS